MKGKLLLIISCFVTAAGLTASVPPVNAATDTPVADSPDSGPSDVNPAVAQLAEDFGLPLGEVQKRIDLQPVWG